MGNTCKPTAVSFQCMTKSTTNKNKKLKKKKRHRFNSWVRKIPWRRVWQSTPGFLPGESHGQRSLEGYSSQGHKESDKNDITQHRGQKSKIRVSVSGLVSYSTWISVILLFAVSSHVRDSSGVSSFSYKSIRVVKQGSTLMSSINLDDLFEGLISNTQVVFNI